MRRVVIFRSLPALILFSLLRLQAQQAPSFFDDTSVHDVYLTVDPLDWATLQRDYLLNTYYPAQFEYRGHKLAKIGIRSRGSGSRSPDKPNLLIVFDRFEKGTRVEGLAAIILKANNQDGSLLREILTMQLFRQMGVPAPREAPARLFLNGEYFGAYTIVERVDDFFLNNRYGESSGYLYEWEAIRSDTGYRFEYLGPDPAAYSPVLWSPSNHESDPDPGPIVEFTDLINNASDEEFNSRVGEYLDVDTFLRFIAVDVFVADYDGFLGTVFGMNNFYAYRFAGQKRFTFIPWDKDHAFEWEYTPVFDGINQNVLTRRLINNPDWRNAYLSYLNAVAQLAGPDGSLINAEVDRLASMIRDFAMTDPHKQCTFAGVMMACGAPEFEAGVAHLKAFAATRSGYVMAETRNAAYTPVALSPRPPEAVPTLP